MTTNENERFLRVKSGAVYRYSEALAKRRDALLVDGHAAADYYRSIGVKNDITEKYPPREEAIPVQRPRSVQRRPSPKSKVVVSDEQIPDELEELMGKDVKNLL